MRLWMAAGIVAALAALAPGAAAQCTSSSSTTDLGVAQVEQYEDGCTYDWGSYGYEIGKKGVGVTASGASANAEVWKVHSWSNWGDFSYDSQSRWASVQAQAAGHTAHADSGVWLGHYKASSFCIDYVEPFVYVPPAGWGGWWGGGSGNTLLPPMDLGAWAGLPCTGAMPLPVPLP